MIGGEYYTQPVHDKFGKLICPVCGVEVESSSSICPTCKINFMSEM
jgi:rubrerythrin